MYNQWMPAANRLLVMEEGDRSECERIVRSRKTAVSIAKRTQMLVLAARGLSNRQIALELGANEHVVGRVRKEYSQRGLAVLEDRARPGRPRSSRDEQRVQKVVETVCRAPAKGLSRWSARQQAVHQSGQELEHFLKSFIQEYNKRCGPFEWTKGPEKLRRIIELTEQWQSQ